MSDLNFGTILTKSQNKDAVHMAVAPVVAACVLRPGEHIGLDNEGSAVTQGGNHIGIVDPFLRVNVRVGETFWLFLYPGTITALRHEWSHPAFEPSVDKQWIIDFSGRVGLSYQTLMNGAETWLESRQNSEWGSYLNMGPLLEGQHVPEEFWTRYEAVTKTVVPEDHKGSFFTCSCD